MVFVILHTPWPISEGFDHPYLHVCACLLLCFMLVLASLVLGFATFDALSGYMVVWLHPMPRRLCLDVTTWEASSDVGLLHVHPSLFCSAWWYAYHACLRHPLAFYASLHTCLHVHAWVLLASVSSMLQHNEVIDIQSKPTFVPHGHYPCLFAILLCFPFCLHPGFYLCHVYHVYPLYASLLCFLHLFLPWLVCRFLIFTFACMHADMSQATTVSRFRSLVFPFSYVLFKIPSSLLPFPLKWFVFGISCLVPFVLISRVWRPLFIFLQLYFGSGSRDVGIYFLSLCACIVHDVCIYTCSPLPVWSSQSMSSKLKRCLIFAAKVRWCVARYSPWKSSTQLECHRKA